MDDIDDITDSIVSQLKNTITPNLAEPTISNIDKNNIEQYIVDKSATLVDQAMTVVASLKDYVAIGGADAKEISAFAEVVNAATSALESLNKLHTAKERSKTAIELKEMDIKAKLDIAAQDNTTRLVLGREELMKRLLEDSNAIDIE